MPETLKYVGWDGYVASRVREAGYKLIRLNNVFSTHLRPNLKSNLKRAYAYGFLGAHAGIEKLKRKSVRYRMVLILLHSPVRGLEISFRKKQPLVALYYPIERFMMMKGFFDGLKST